MKQSEIVKKLIKNKGYSQRAFAHKIGMPPSTLNSIINRGINNANIDNVIKICKGLDITVEELDKKAKGEEIEEQNIDLSEEEKTLVCKYRKLTKEKQQYVQGIIQSTLDMEGKHDIKKNTAQ